MAISVPATGARISNVKISGANQGIVFGEAKIMNPGRSTLENIRITDAGNVGVYLSGTMDVPYDRNVVVSGSSERFRTQGIAFKMAQNDDLRMSDCIARESAISSRMWIRRQTMTLPVPHGEACITVRRKMYE